MKSLPYIVIVYMLAQSSCTPKLLKEYAGSPRTFYEKDTAELKLDIDSVKQYSRVLSFFGVKNNEKYCIFIVPSSRKSHSDDCGLSAPCGQYDPRMKVSRKACH